MMATLTAPGTALLGEAPRWMSLFGHEPALHFADLLCGSVHSIDGTDAYLALDFPGETVSALIPLSDGGVAIALNRTVAIFDREGSSTRTIDLDLPPGQRLSDATAGPTGELWIGVVPSGEATVSGMLVSLDGKATTVQRDAVGFSNGLGFTADGTALLQVDSATNTLWQIEHDPASGALGDARELFCLPATEGALDGLCLDELDRVWIAVFGAGAVICVDGDGTIVDRISVPAPRVSSCTFGAGSTLYMTTARIDAADDELSRHPLAGSVFQCETGVAGGTVWKGTLRG